ncbi:MAG: M1 family aminopeptidase [Rhodocyclaceae bacterium]|nr:M1 family aminopeptidase [Rhodocyclaceae bacterium]
MSQFLAAVVAGLALLAPWPALAAAPALDLQVELDPATRRFEAIAVVTPVAGDFHFELHESLAVRAATVGGRTLAVVADGQQGSLRGWRVRLPADADRLRLAYGGTLPALERNLDYREVLGGLPPMASNEGSFLPAGAAWYPQPAPRFTYRVSVSVPAGQRALVPGRLVAETAPSDAAGPYRASFEFDHPIDGIDLMAGPWTIRERMAARADGTPVRLRSYFFPDLDASPGLADGYLGDVQRYIERYSGEIGAYPFTQFSVVASPLPTGFGMPTLTYLGAAVLKLPFIRATSLGHEVLHDWWGNGVGVDYAKGNWSEGLTTFMADYAYKEEESAAAARAMRLGWLRDFAAVPASDQQTLASFRARRHGAGEAVGYGKSAMLFLMLRDAIGDAAFHRGIRSFWAQQRFKAASWDDLRAAFEQASGRPLGGFFDQWLNRAGGPAVSIVKAVAAARAGGAVTLTVSVEQRAPPYALHLPLEIDYPNRAELRWIDVKGAHAEVRLALDAAPAGLRLDPDLRVYRRLERDQLPPILRQWIVARAPRLLVASPAADVREAAVALASRLFEAAPTAAAPNALGQPGEPLLLAGLHADVDAALAAAKLPPRPAAVAGRGSAQVWTVEHATGAPLAVVSADDADALRALLRPLPHYGGQSWLVFAGSRAVDRGVWPAPGRLIPVRLAH